MKKNKIELFKKIFLILAFTLIIFSVSALIFLLNNSLIFQTKDILKRMILSKSLNPNNLPILTKHKDKICEAERGRYIGSEILLIKKEVPINLVIKKAFVLSLFGFYSMAQNELQRSDDPRAKEFYISINKVKKNISKITFRIVLRKLAKYIKSKL